jgi:DNA replication protein DnaC
MQATGEDDKPFVARVREGRETDARVFGISIADRPSLRAIAGWKPEHGSMFIEGAPGTGKSIAAAALANDLVTVPMSYRCVCRDCEDRWRSATDATMDDPWEGWDQERHDRTRGAARLRVTGPSSVRYQQEGGIIAALRKPKEEGQGQVKAGVLDVCKAVEVLFLDDLGSKEALADWHKDVLFELIDWRYTQVRPRRPVVFTSNMPMSDLSLRYGERFASRVREMVGDRRYQLTTMWR